MFVRLPKNPQSVHLFVLELTLIVVLVIESARFVWFVLFG